MSKDRVEWRKGLTSSDEIVLCMMRLKSSLKMIQEACVSDKERME